MNKITLALLLSHFAAASPPQQSCSPTGAVRGIVSDQSGKPIGAARVFISQTLPASAVHQAAPPVVTGPHMTSAITDSNGQFVAFLPAGSYVACPETTTQGLLDPCRWSTSVSAFTVKSGTTTEVGVAMAAGAIQSIHVADPGQLLTPVNGVVDPSCRFVMQTPQGYTYDAVIVNKTSTSRDHMITIPFGSALTMRVVCPHLVVNDGSGNPAPTAGTAVLAAPGASPATANFTVAAIKP